MYVYAFRFNDKICEPEKNHSAELPSTPSSNGNIFFSFQWRPINFSPLILNDSSMPMIFQSVQNSRASYKPGAEADAEENLQC